MSTLGKVVSTAAPILGSVLNSVLPGSGLIISGLKALFGVQSNDNDELATAISNDPNAALKLAEFEITHRHDLDQILANDRASARDRESEIVTATGKRDWVMEFIAIIMVMGFFGMCFIISFVPIAKTDTNLLYLVIGQFSTGFITILSYYFGATKKSQEINLPAPAQTRS